MEEKYEKVLNKCRDTALKFKIPVINSIEDIYEALLLEEKITITFVEVGGAVNGLAAVAKYLCGEDIFRDYFKSLHYKNEWCIRLEYGENIALYAGEILDEFKIDAEQLQSDNSKVFVLTVPLAFLQNKTIVLLNMGNGELISTREITASGEIYLLTNAAMAMTEVQKSWISSRIQKNFDCDRFYVCLSGTELLLEETQEIQVINYIDDYLNKYSGAECIKLDSGIIDRIQALDGQKLKTQSQKRVVKNMIHEIMEVLEYELDKLKIREEDYVRVEKQLETYRVQLVAMGKVTAESVLDNQIHAIIDAVSDSAEEYSDAMCESIRNAIMTAKDIEEAESKIRPYMERSWVYFAKQTSIQIAKDFDSINSKLTGRMEEDIYGIMKHLDVSDQVLLEKTMNFSDADYSPHIDYEGASDDVLRKVSRNARNMMILSIPLLFLSPTLSVTALVGGGIYSHLGKKSEDRKYREELLSHVEKSCQMAKKDAIQEFTDTLNHENIKMKELVLQGYQNVTDMLKEELGKRREASAEFVELAAGIQRVLTEDMPSFLNTI